MKKLKAFFRKYMSRITINMSKQPLIVTLLGLLIVNIVILVVASFLATLLDPEVFPTFVEAFANGSMKWMISPNSILYMEANSSVMILAGVVVVIEMVIFMGTIIAMTTNILRDYLVKRGGAKGKLILMDHVLILNWNSKVAEILVDLMHKEDSITVLVLSNKDREYVQSHIQSAIREDIKKNKLDLIVRKGDPYSRSELEDVCIFDAKSVVVMSEEGIDNTMTNNYTQTDINALKLLLLVGSFKLRDKCNIVVEVEEYHSVGMLEGLTHSVESLKNRFISAVSFNRKLGHILAQTIFHPRLASVYMDLFSFKGEEFYPTDICDIDEYLSKFTEGIPIVNYSKLYVLTSASKKLNTLRSKPYFTDRRLKQAKIKPQHKINLYIFGDSKKRDYLIENLNRVIDDNFSMKIHDDYSCDLIIKSKKNEENIVLILSDDKVREENYDANVFCTLIDINKHCKDDNISLITEILDPRNVNSIKDFKVKNAIISNQLISFIIAQMLNNAGSKEFFDNLLLLDNEEEEGFDLVIESVEDILDMKQDLTFESKTELVNCFYHSFDKKYMLIGLIQDGLTNYLSQDMDKEAKITLKEKDELIMIKY